MGTVHTVPLGAGNAEARVSALALSEQRWTWRWRAQGPGMPAEVVATTDTFATPEAAIAAGVASARRFADATAVLRP